MEITNVDIENSKNQNLCCAVADKKHKLGVDRKKELIIAKLKNGYVFKKFDLPGKVFIDYCPIEVSFLPVEAEGYLAINCCWVSGKYAGKGYARKLLAECIKDAKKYFGVVVICGNRKVPYLNDKSFFEHSGFEVVDKAPPYFELMVYKNPENQEITKNPTFLPKVYQNTTNSKKDFVIYYSDQCPFTTYYVENLRLQLIKNKQTYQINHITTRKEAEVLPTAFNIFSLFYKNKFITHKIPSEKEVEKILKEVEENKVNS